MNADPKASFAQTDHERIEQILEILPEVDTRHFADELLSDAQYHDRNRPNYEVYDEGIVRNKLFAFNDPELRKRYHELSVVFATLDDFLPQHFFHIESDLYGLYPEWKKSADPEHRHLWRENYDELQEITLLFQSKYNALLAQFRKPNAHAVQNVGATISETHENDGSVRKGRQRITLPRFPRTDWVKVSITFTDDRNILLRDNKDTKPCDFEGFGCKNQITLKPNLAWAFLRALALGNGTITISDRREREKIKKQKQTITDTLRKIFHNDTDPFEIDMHGSYTAKFHIEYLPPTERSGESDKRFADLSVVKEEMTSLGDKKEWIE